MKRMPQNQSRKTRHQKRSPVYALAVIFLGCLVGLGILGPAMPWPSSSASADSSSALVRRPSTPDTQAKSADGVWSGVGQSVMANVQQQHADLRSFRRVALDQNALATILHAAPMEFSEAAAQRRLILTLPDPRGTFARFSIAESPIMAPELAARFPEIRTYTGQGLDDPTATTRFDWTPLGFHAIVLSEKGTILIEPSGPGDVENYVVYFQNDVVLGSGECDVTEQDQQAALARNPSAKHSQANPAVLSGTTLRNYRLAAAATAEYTAAYGGGTVSAALSAITTTVNLVDAIYEREVAVRLTLIAGETSIIFTDTTTDGYTTENVNALVSENQNKLNTVIGAANYDIGHVFDGRLLGGGAFSWQGLATIGGVCIDSAKARGVDIFRSVSPTSVFAYYSAAHEIGHQFGASHTFNATSLTCGPARSAFTAYEPLNGSTIMAYRFACDPEDLRSTDTYFHNASIEQIVNFTMGVVGNSCAVTSATGNNPPVIDAGPTYTIPMGTPFILTATGGDPDGDALTFGWEEFDLGTAAPPSTDDGSRPIFRSFLPTSSPSRTFPRLQDVLSGSATFGESLPVTTRTMNFRVTARDNRTGGGGVNSAATQVNVRADAGPFTVTQPASGAAWVTFSNQTVSWNVAGTNSGSVNCANVKITLSTDGGTTFPFTLANNTPNDGSEVVIIPGTPGTGNARIKVEGVGNIFFNISRGFTVTDVGSHGDYDSDGLTDIAVFRPSSGAWYLLRSSTSYDAAQFQSFGWGGNDDVAVPGDYDGDGKADIAIYRPSNGGWYILKSSTNFNPAQFMLVGWGGNAGDVPVPGDYDGDGKTDIAIFRPSNGGWYILKSTTNYNPAQFQLVGWGNAGDVPVPADYDGDGKTDIAIYRSSNGGWYILKSTTNYDPAQFLLVGWGGNAGDVGVPADYDGDVKADIAIYRPSNGGWYILKSSTNYNPAQFLLVGWGGNAGDVGVPGDYDGDGKADIAIYRPSNGGWYILKSSTNYNPAQFLLVGWGGPSDTAVPIRRIR